MKELEANWLQALRSGASSRAAKVATVSKLFDRNPGTACAEAQRLAAGGR